MYRRKCDGLVDRRSSPAARNAVYAWHRGESRRHATVMIESAEGIEEARLL